MIAIETIEQKSTAIVTQAKGLKVTDPVSMKLAGEINQILVALQNEVHETFDPIVSAAHKAHKEALEGLKKHLTPLVEAEAYLKNQSKVYLVQQETLRRQEEERIRREEARRQEEIYRQQREVEEAKRRQEELLRRAAEAEAQGKAKQAEKLFEKAVAAEPVFAPPPPPVVFVPLPPVETKVEGLGSRKVWKWRPNGKEEVPRAYLILNEPLLNGLAKVHKGNEPPIPGIEFYQDIEMRRT